MTNKQAQITINAIKFMLDNAQYSEDVEEALNMAINALTAQPENTQLSEEDATSDCISRQDAIDAVVGCTNCGTEDELRAYVTKHYLDNGWTGGIVDALDAIEQLPPAQPNLQPTCNQLATDCIIRQAAIDVHCEICGDRGRCNPDICPDMEVFQLLPPAQPEIIRCKDCKHRPIEKDGEIMPPKEDDWKCPCLCDDYFYSWRPKDKFFCASGERWEECFTDAQDAEES